MPNLLTEITELSTGLGMTGVETLDGAIAAQPSAMQNVTDAHWARLAQARASGLHTGTFEMAWANGRAFFESPDGLRGRVPLAIEWKGAHQPPGFDLIPVDLRVDHVFLVSCKYESRILSNSSPSNLFDRRLADRTAGPGEDPWYGLCAAEEYEHFYSCVRRHVGQALLPGSAQGLGPIHLARIRHACARRWPSSLAPLWAEFSLAVAEASAGRWRAQLPTAARREEMLWRLLRLSPASYFILGATDAVPFRLRVGTPWDWRQHFVLHDLTVAATPAGQPRVSWMATVTERVGEAERVVAGHVEVRWAHGRFSSVEAKIYLDTPHQEVPGYFPLALP